MEATVYLPKTPVNRSSRTLRKSAISIKVVCDHVEDLKPIGHFLGE